MVPDLRTSAHQIANYILAHSQTERSDRLWPSDPATFQTNPLNLAHGATGIALFLHETLGEIPDEVRTWMLAQPTSVQTYPPGLHFGLSGIAYAYWELGFTERAEELMALAFTSPLLYDDPTMLCGMAGWGWACLYFHERTQREHYLERAVEAGTRLLETAIETEAGLSWPYSVDDRVHFGFAYGSSGVALFLLQLAARTGDPAFERAAHRAFAYDLANGTMIPEGLQWQRFAGDNLVEPYWLHGASGVGTTAIRFYQHTGDEEYLKVAESIAASVRVQFAVLPGQWEGMAGLAEFHLDMYAATSKPVHLDSAMELAKSILWYRIDTPSGLAWPGRLLLRISTDFATGSAGIGSLFNRIGAARPRVAIDLPGTWRDGRVTADAAWNSHGSLALAGSRSSLTASLA